MLLMDSSHCCTQYVMYDALDSFIKLIKYSKSDKTQRLISSEVRKQNCKLFLKGKYSNRPY